MLPSVGGRNVLRATRACTAAVATRGLLPLWRASSPAMRSFSKRFFQRQIVGPVVFSCDAIRSQVNPSASPRMIRARNTSPAGSVRDCAHRVSSVLSSAVTSSNFRYCPTSLRRIEDVFSYDRDSLLERAINSSCRGELESAAVTASGVDAFPKLKKCGKFTTNL